MRILGVDYGLKNTGLALGVSKGVTLPLKTIRTSDKKTLISEIKNICIEEKIDLVVVGVPDNKNNKQKDLTLDFVSKLKEELNVPVETVNEFGTSKEVFSKEFIKHSKIKKLKKNIHAKSAEGIINNYWLSLG